MFSGYRKLDKKFRISETFPRFPCSRGLLRDSVKEVLRVCGQGKNIIVFYGSQTGTAEEFANRLSKDAQRYGMKGMAADPEEYSMVMWTHVYLY